MSEKEIILLADSDLKEISPLKLLTVIRERKPLGKFYCTDISGYYAAVDNSNGHAWTEEFETKKEALSWLKGEFEIGDLEIKP